MEEEREKVRQHLREKYNLEKPESVDEPEEESDSSSSSSSGEEEDDDDDDEDCESVDKEKIAREEAMEKLASMLCIM